MKSTYFVSVARGLEAGLRVNLSQLGVREIIEARAGVYFTGDIKDAYKVCLYSPIASGVYLMLSSFEANNESDLYEGAFNIEWDKHIDRDSTFVVDASVGGSVFTNSMYVSMKVKDAVADFFRDKYGSRPSVSVVSADIKIAVAINGRKVRISLSLSGEPLHKRGYRKHSGMAALRETLAASLLLKAGWGEAEDNATLLEPMCGSGTIAIEGALMATGQAVGLLRESFGFLKWKNHDSNLWNTLKEEAKSIAEEKRNSFRGKIIACDINRHALNDAKENAYEAGVGNIIHFEKKDATKGFPKLPKPLYVVTNAPYGERLGEDADVKDLYQGFASCLSSEGADSTFLGLFGESSHLWFGLSNSRREEFRNGPINCVLVKARIPSKEEKFSESALMFSNRLRKNKKYLGRWARKNNISVYRVYEADIPQYAFALDIYETDDGRYIHTQEYAPPKSVDEEDALRRRIEAIAVIQDVFECEGSKIIFKTRIKRKKKEQYKKNEEKGDLKIVNEGTLSFWVDLTGYLDTGLFADHRITRGLIRDEAKDKDFLNLFAYTASFSVYAALGGARSTTSVDFSKTYLRRARQNFELNKMPKAKNRLIREDCITWLKEASQNHEKYSLIFVDPPTFSNSKSLDTSFDVQKDHEKLIRLCMSILTEDGVLYFSNNFRGFKIDKNIEEMFVVDDITSKTIARDFERNPKIHKVFRIKKKLS